MAKLVSKIFGSTAFMLLWCVVVVPGFVALAGWWMIDGGIRGRWVFFFTMIPGFVANVYNAVRCYYMVRRWWRGWRERHDARREMKRWAKDNGVDEKSVVVVPPIAIEEHELAELERDPDAFMRKKILADPNSYPAGLVEAMREQDGEFKALD